VQISGRWANAAFFSLLSIIKQSLDLAIALKSRLFKQLTKVAFAGTALTVVISASLDLQLFYAHYCNFGIFLIVKIK
jgi:hypothetical protein